MNPCPRSRAADVPAIPSSSTALPSPPSASQRNLPAMKPPATLSDAMWETISPPLAPRSMVNTGMPASFAFSIEGTIASASVGLTRITSTPCWMRSSMLVASIVESSWESTTTSVTPAAPAAASAPSFNVTKKGLLSVDRDSPKVTPSASGAAEGAHAVITKPRTTSKPSIVPIFVFIRPLSNSPTKEFVSHVIQRVVSLSINHHLLFIDQTLALLCESTKPMRSQHLLQHFDKRTGHQASSNRC